MKILFVDDSYVPNHSELCYMHFKRLSDRMGVDITYKTETTNAEIAEHDLVFFHWTENPVVTVTMNAKVVKFTHNNFRRVEDCVPSLRLQRNFKLLLRDYQYSNKFNLDLIKMGATHISRLKGKVFKVALNDGIKRAMLHPIFIYMCFIENVDTINMSPKNIQDFGKILGNI